MTRANAGPSIASSHEADARSRPADVAFADRDLWRRLAEAESREAFCQGWLALQCAMIADARLGFVALGPAESGPFTPVAAWPAGRKPDEGLAAAAERALAERRGVVVEPAADDPGDDAGARVAYPIHVEGILRGVVAIEVAVRARAGLQEVLRQLQWGAAWFDALLGRERADNDARARARLKQVLDLVATALEREDFQGAAMGVVTELATRLGCDRVSLGVLRRGRARVVALSHSAQFGKEMNLVRAIAQAMDEAIDQRTTVVFPETGEGEPRITRLHGALARDHGSGASLTLPLFAGARIFGALTFERPGDRPFDRATVDLCEGVAAMVAPILDAKHAADRSPIRKLGDALARQLARLLGPRHWGRKLFALAALGAVAFFSIATGEFRVTGEARLEGTLRRMIVAPFDGYIATVRARPGDQVRAGAVLSTLYDEDLKLEHLRLKGRRRQLERQYNDAMAARRLSEANIVTAQIAQTDAQIEAAEAQLARTRITAPFDGLIVSGDLSQSLGASVTRGQVLYELTPLDGYRVVLRIDEGDIGAVAAGQVGNLLLTALPDEPLPFTVTKITPVSTPGDGRNFFDVEARLATVSERLRPGMEGVGKIDAGERKLIWIWTYKLVDRLRVWAWTWLP